MNRIKRISLPILLVFFVLNASAQTLVSDAAHSRLGFTITHLMISHVTGNFKQFEMKLVSSKPDYSDAKVEVTAQIASINTDQERRDNDLKSDAFFDAAKFPTLNFESTSVKHISGNDYELKGNLTMHGITKPVVLQVNFVGKVQNPMNKKEISVFSIKGTLSRLEFGIGSKYPSSMVGDEIDLDASAEMSAKN